VTPAGRLSAAAEVLDQVCATRIPADEVLKAWGKAHRFAGSKDRRAIAERVFAVLRARARLAWRMDGEALDGHALNGEGRALVLASLAELDGLELAEIEALASGEGHALAPLSEAERARLIQPPSSEPDWVRAGAPAFVVEMLKARFGEAWADEASALIGKRAPLDLRVNSLRGGVEQAINLLKTDDIEPERTPFSALGLRLPPELAPDVQKLRAFMSGWVEVQDEASQIAAALAGARPGFTVIDYCAGGGGKTLALGAAMRARVKGEGRLIACDVHGKRLDAMRPRLQRADVHAEVRRIGNAGEGLDDLTGRADLVFVDAPCSGAGTWRRHPEGAWRITAETVARLAELQGAILARASKLVKPGGRLAYATCSVLTPENEGVAEAFAAAHPQFRPIPIAKAAETPLLTDAARARLGQLAQGGHMLQMTPNRSGTDGFFLALFERTA
jgi:16S rRNA (cytosine967-C5)-methyltransferase